MIDRKTYKVVDYKKGYVKRTRMTNLRKDDLFFLLEPDEPDVTNSRNQLIYIALENPKVVVIDGFPTTSIYGKPY